MAGNELTVRVLRAEDLPALVEIDTTASGMPRADYLQDKARRSLDSQHPTVIAVVAETEGKVVGFLMGQVFKGEFGIPDAVAIVDTVGIRPDYQGRGTGRRLMGEFLLRAKKAGAVQVRTIVDWNQWILLGFFRTLGFAPGTGIMLQRSI
jgi:ribosomal protein S18 acetylase RimI-like enzyme